MSWSWGGRSTTWWLNRGNRVLTLETDPSWAQGIEDAHSKRDNFEGVIFQPELTRETLAKSSGLFDVIVIDHNVKREEAVDWVSDLLHPDGFIVFDNSDRVEYETALRKLKKMSYGFISFFGLVPGLHYATETTVFSKTLTAPFNEGEWRNSIRY